MNLFLEFLASFLGSILAWILVFHFDLEGLWQERRYKHGQKLEEKKRRRRNG